MFTTVARTTWCCQLIGSNQLHNCRVSRYCFFCTAKTDRALASPGNLQHTPGKKKRLKFCCELGPPKSILFPVKQWNRQHQLSTSQTGSRGPSDMLPPTSTMERNRQAFPHLSSFLPPLLNHDVRTACRIWRSFFCNSSSTLCDWDNKGPEYSAFSS